MLVEYKEDRVQSVGRVQRGQSVGRVQRGQSVGRVQRGQSVDRVQRGHRYHLINIHLVLLMTQLPNRSTITH